MYELNRIRLVGIGPAGARYDDVTMDMSGVGEPAGSGDLFGDGPRRPSPFSLLMLENGGGKSVLLKLIFSVVLPGRRRTIGGTSLEDYVLDGDTGHVILEWMHARTGAKLLTGKVSQRRSRHSSGNLLAEAWYTLRPSLDLDLDRLPVVADGRRVRFEGYRAALADRQRINPALELTWCAEDHRGWRAALATAGIDSDLFDIQRRMNLDEGDAADAFTFTSAKGFVDWLLTTATEKEEVRSMADTFHQYAETIAERGSMLAERDFLEGTIAGLEPLAEAHTAAVDAARDANAAARAAHTLHRALCRRTEEEKARAADLAAKADAARAEATSRTTARDTARDQLNEVRLQTLMLAAAELARDQERNADQIRDAELTAQAWALLPEIARVRELADAAHELAAQVAAADTDAEPALRRRDEAAGRLLAKLDAAAAYADLTADAHLARAEELDADVRRHGAEQTAAAATVARAETERDGALAVISSTTAAVNLALRDGLLPAGAGAADVQRAHVDAVESHAVAKDAVTAADAEVVAARDRAQERHADAAAATRTAAGSERIAAQAEAAMDAANRAARRVADLPAVVAATEFGPGETLDTTALDRSADTLLQILRADIEAHTEGLDALRADRDRTDRLLNSLGEGGLLPPRVDVEAALRVLQDNGVAAHSGWRYLAETTAAADRAALITRAPDLADGVVLVDPDQLGRARDALAAAELLPCAAIRVDSGSELLHPRGSAGGFVIDPTPAMFDEEAAEARRVDLAGHREDLGQQIATRSSAHQQAFAAASALDAWREHYPPGAVATLAEQLADALTAHDKSTEAMHEASRAAENAAAEALTAEGAAARARDLERALAEKATALRALESATTDAVAAGERVTQAELTIRRARATQEEADTAQQEAQQRAGQERTLAERVRGEARAHRTRASKVVSTTQARASEVPDSSLAHLSSSWEAAQAAYTAVAAGSDLKAAADDAAAAHRDARAKVGLQPSGIVAAAHDLLTGDAAADPALWEAGGSAARDHLADLTSVRQDHATTAGKLGEAIRSARRPQTGGSWMTLEERWRPRDVAHGRQLEADAEDFLVHANSVVESATASATEVAEAHARTERTVAAFELATGPLAGALRTHRHPAEAVLVAAYPGPADGVADEVDRALSRLSTTGALAQESAATVSEMARELVTFARAPRFDALDSPARQSVVGLKDDELAARSAEFAELLRARLSSLESDLANADRYRSLLVERLANLVDQALKTLRQAQRLSELPADLGDWGRRPFLSIRFAVPDLPTTTVHVSRIVDEAADAFAERSRTSRGTSPSRDGMSLLLDGVHAAVPKGFTVTVLKPDAVLRDERVDIADMGKVFSGGQALTAAIVLYCTLAALRGNERGQMRAKHSGVLFLDNPIGKASATYLLALQKAVAAALGVQLVYTTGLSDDRVLAEFPLWVRLRNDADARANLKHISVAETVRAHLPGPDSPDGYPGTISATRVYRRPAVVPTA